MPKRETEDGGHTAFTDHNIVRRPRNLEGPRTTDQLAPWRDPAPGYASRNLAIALADIAMLRSAQMNFPEDPALLTALGTALRARNEPVAAARLFETVIKLRPADPLAEENAGMAWMEAGEKETAARHLERALELDPLLLPDIELLLAIYREVGDVAKENELMNRVRQAMRTR